MEQNQNECTCKSNHVCSTGNYYYYNCGGGQVPIIGENGNWFIGVTDTGIKAQGPAGVPGPMGPEGPKGEAGTTLHSEVLFNGNAHVINQEVPLSNPISRYKLLIIFVAAHQKNMNRFVYRDGIIVYPEDIEYDPAMLYSYCCKAILLGGGISIAIPSENSFMIAEEKIDVNPNWDYIAVTRIIGIYERGRTQ